jgi:hypothetical protein
VSHQANDLNISQHSEQLVMKCQPLLRAEALYAIKRQVNMISQALRLMPARVVATLWTAFTI